jgi:hypothetical protein
MTSPEKGLGGAASRLQCLCPDAARLRQPFNAEYIFSITRVNRKARGRAMGTTTQAPAPAAWMALLMQVPPSGDTPAVVHLLIVCPGYHE